MVSTVDVLSEQPWGRTYTEWHDGFHLTWRRIRRSVGYEFPAQFKLIKDSKSGYWSRGDLILFNSGYYNWTFDHKCSWKKWFMSKRDYLNALENDEMTFRDKRIPKYARLECAILLSRYKWIKEKDYKFYHDYGSVIMMLTGSKAGHIRRYYLKTPYGKVSEYPYDHIVPYYRRNGDLEEIPELGRIQEAMNYAKTKDEFILNVVSSFHDENYPMNLEEKNDTPANFRVV